MFYHVKVRVYVREKEALEHIEMANDELKHATYLHDIATQEIEELNKVFQPTVEMEEKWDKSHTLLSEYIHFHLCQ